MIRPDDIAPEVRAEIETALSSAMHVGARPLAAAEWRALLNDVGFDAGAPQLVPMHLLTPARLVADEGLWGALKFFKNVATNAAARKRMLGMRQVFRRCVPAGALVAPLCPRGCDYRPQPLRPH